MDFSLFLAASAAANRFTEFFKPTILKAVPDDWQAAALQLLAVVAGVVVALIGSLNLFAGVAPNLDQTLGIVLTGILAGFGSEALHAILDLLYAWKDAQPPPAAKA